MKNYFKIISTSNILNSIIFILIGIFLIICPNFILNIFNLLLAGFFIIYGILEIINFIAFKDFNLGYTNLAIGVISIILAILSFNAGQILETFIRIILSVWIIFSGLRRLGFALILYKARISKSWGLALLFSIFIIICGIYILFTPNALVITLGMIILIYSILDLFESILFMTTINKLK